MVEVFLLGFYKPAFIISFICDDFISRFTGDKLVRDDYFLRPNPCLIQTRFDITPIRQRLVCGEKYSRQRGSRESHKNFSHAKKSWFTVSRKWKWKKMENFCWIFLVETGGKFSCGFHIHFYILPSNKLSNC